MGTASRSSEPQEPSGGCRCNTYRPRDVTDMLRENTWTHILHTHIDIHITLVSSMTYSLLIAGAERPETPGDGQSRAFDRVRALERALQPDVRAVHRLHATRRVHLHRSHALPSCNAP